VAATEILPLVADSITELEIERLRPPCLTLRPVDEKTVLELMRSIQNMGLLQPIMVREIRGGYQVVFGSHRIEACRRLGMTKILATIKQLSDAEAFLARVTENLLRNVRMNPVEEAQGYKMLIHGGWTIDAIGKKVGKCDSYVCERLRLLENLDSRLLEQVSHGGRGLTPSHAELLARISDKHKQTEIAELIESRKLSVRAIEAMLNGIPLPTRVQVVDEAGTCCLHIPSEFVRAMRLKPGQTMRLSVRGRKLVFEASRVHGKRQLPQFEMLKNLPLMQSGGSFCE